jgi:methylmalonyl-CoA mutase cobalamin-binding subunit
MPDLPDRIQELRERAAAQGRERIPIYIFGVTGGAEQVQRYAELGVDECVFLLPTLPRPQTVEALQEMAKAVL